MMKRILNEKKKKLRNGKKQLEKKARETSPYSQAWTTHP
jgi:hypothetical protein